MNPVVISGAGPNGLMLACELALGGVRPVVLDALPGPSAEPKANGLAGQVIRVLDQRGLYQTFSGQDAPPQPSAGWMFAAMPLDFTGLADNPMYALRIPQPRLVRLLEKRARDLGVDLRWGHELTGLRQSAESVVVEVLSPDGSYRLPADYLVGADGGHSFVRKATGIGFPGSTSNTVGRLAHVHIPAQFRNPAGGLDIPGFGHLPIGHTRVDGGGLIYAEFEPGRSMFGTLEAGPLEDESPMSLAELRDSARRVLGADLPLEEPNDAGPHALRRIDGWNTRQAERYRDGKILLLGDAAHVHSAMGGPGLNLGLQDAVNLGWKLAAEVKGWAPPGLLDTYQSERYPVGKRVMMHSLAQTALMAPGPEVGALRELFSELLVMPAVGSHLAELLAGSDERYEVGDDHPLSGRLVPDLTLKDGRRIASLLHEAHPVLLELGDGSAADAARDWAGRVDIVCAESTQQSAAAILIRPDGYIAWATDAFDRPGLVAAMRRWVGAASPK